MSPPPSALRWVVVRITVNHLPAPRFRIPSTSLVVPSISRCVPITRPIISEGLAPEPRLRVGSRIVGEKTRTQFRPIRQ